LGAIARHWASHMVHGTTRAAGMLCVRCRRKRSLATSSKENPRPSLGLPPHDVRTKRRLPSEMRRPRTIRPGKLGRNPPLTGWVLPSRRPVTHRNPPPKPAAKPVLAFLMPCEPHTLQYTRYYSRNDNSLILLSEGSLMACYAITPKTLILCQSFLFQLGTDWNRFWNRISLSRNALNTEEEEEEQQKINNNNNNNTVPLFQ
jgi:hypothetical protein